MHTGKNHNFSGIKNRALSPFGYRISWKRQNDTHCFLPYRPKRTAPSIAPMLT